MPSDKEPKKIARRRGGREEIFFFTRKDKRETGQQGNVYKTIYPNCDLWSDIGDVCLLRIFLRLNRGCSNGLREMQRL